MTIVIVVVVVVIAIVSILRRVDEDVNIVRMGRGGGD